MKHIMLGIISFILIASLPSYAYGPSSPLPTLPSYKEPKFYFDSRKQEVTLYILSYNRSVSIEEASVIGASIVDFSDCNSIPHQLTVAVVTTESIFDTRAHNRKTNCIGLMQIRPEFGGSDVWLKTLLREKLIDKKSDLHDPVKNIRSGCYILKQYLTKHDSLYKALSAYGGDITKNEYAYKVYGNITRFRNFVDLLKYKTEYKLNPKEYLVGAIANKVWDRRMKQG